MTSPSSSPSSTARLTWSSRGRALLAGLLLGLTVALLPVVPAEASSHSVTIQHYAYGPASMNVEQGDTVTWTNLDSVEHVVVTSGPASFRSPLLSKGQSWSYTFTTPGTYSYTCSVHPDMRGSITAAAAPPTPAPTTAASTRATQPPVAPATTQQSAPVVAGAPSPSMPPKTGKPGNHAPTPVTPAAAPQPTYAAPAVAQPSTLNPLLLVAGASIAVVVFCLLLMASRPQAREQVGVPNPE